MKERVALVTGGSAGVGRAAALALARLGASVVLLSRNRQRAESTRRELVAATGNERIELLSADLTEPASIRGAVSAFRRRHRRLDVLLNCAGVLFLKRTATRLGWEATLATEFLGHFLLTASLLDLLKASAPSRVLTVTGNAWPLRFARLDLEDLQLQRGYNPLRAKLRAELAKALFTAELAHRLAGSGVTANAFHPGLIRSGMIAALPWVLRLPAALAMGLVGSEPRTAAYLAVSPEVEGVSGRFFRRPGKAAPLTLSPRQVRQAAELWRIAEALAPAGGRTGEQG